MALQKFPIFGKRRRQELQDLQLLGTMNSDSSFDWDGDDVKDTDKQLKALFDRIDKRGDGKIDVNELGAALRNLGVTRGNRVAQELIWEVDEDMDGFIGYEELKETYERAAADLVGKEPRKLYNVLEFMMADVDDSATLTVDEALECYGKRYGVKNIDALVKRIFTEEELNNPTTNLTFAQYCERDAIFLHESCKQHRRSLLQYGRVTEENNSKGTSPKVRPKPVWRGGGARRSQSSMGFSHEDAQDLLLNLGLPNADRSNHRRVNRQGRRRSVPQSTFLSQHG